MGTLAAPRRRASARGAGALRRRVRRRHRGTQHVLSRIAVRDGRALRRSLGRLVFQKRVRRRRAWRRRRGVVACAGRRLPEGSHFIDAAFAEPSGVSRRVPRAIALYERDGGIAWKHAARAPRARARRVLGEPVRQLRLRIRVDFSRRRHDPHRVLLTGVMASKAAAAGFGGRAGGDMASPR